jgi:GT2 family glycosyltransferase
VFERRQGKASALNSGLAASSADVVVFTDDDVEVEPGWLDAGVRPLLDRADIHYTGGPVLPLWEVPPPSWIDSPSAAFRGPLALLDYGPEPFIFEERCRIPVGANMAVRRRAIQQVGGFREDFDRRGASLFGQGQAEFFFRTRAAGLKGQYVPAMRLRHHVPASRLNPQYHRRWWYWKGVARGRMEAWHPVTELGLNLTAVPRLLRLPRFMWRSAAEDAAGWLGACLRRDASRRLEREIRLAYAIGYFEGRGIAAPRARQVPSSQPAHATEISR